MQLSAGKVSLRVAAARLAHRTGALVARAGAGTRRCAELREPVRIALDANASIGGRCLVECSGQDADDAVRRAGEDEIG